MLPACVNALRGFFKNSVQILSTYIDLKIHTVGMFGTVNT